MSDSVRPHRRQPTGLPYPWDSPGKNTGVGCHFLLQCMKVKSESEVAQLCLTLRNPMNCSLSGSSTHGIFQARVLEWVAIAFSNTLSRFVITFLPRSKHLLISWLQSPSAVTLLLLSRFSRVRLYVTQWMTAHQATPSLGFSRQEHWSGLPFPSPMHESEE